MPRYVYALALTPDEKLLRRQHLDWAGYYVVLSQLAVLALAAVVQRSPRRKPSAVEWWLRAPISLDRPFLKSWGEWGAVAGWYGWCCFLVLRGTGDDYLAVTKACGTVAAAHFPLHFLLASKRSLLRSVCGLSWEGRANFLHRWVGRAIAMLLMAHAILYLKFFWDTNRMTTRLLEFDVLCGVIGNMALTTISVTGNHFVRNCYSYRLFYLMHITLVPLLFPLLYLHVSHLRPYLLASFFIYAADQTARYLARIPATATFTTLSPHLLQITLTSDTPLTAGPGAHAILRIPCLSSWTTNPFTLTSPLHNQKHAQLIARVRDGTTKRLSQLEKARVYVDLPYGAPLHFPDLTRFDRILIVAGGVGGTFAVSWIKHLADVTKPGQVRVVWAVKRTVDAAWALVGEDTAAVKEGVEFYVTGTPADDGEDGGDNDEDGVEMTGLLDKEDALVAVGVRKERVMAGRPSVRSLIEETVEKAGRAGSTAVLVCGPHRMGLVARETVSMCGRRGADIWIHVEEFGH